ncbi:MAG: hypothetical protein MJA29_02890 [Candidatus Omnitrophica bacterium]|nr:hypothetical protein [Candidatus Omnitrophota bacterium]
MGMKVQMQVGGKELKYDVHEQLFFDPEHVFDEIGKQAGQLAWWYSLLALKDEEAENFKVEMDARIAEIELAARRDTDTLVSLYGKVTEAVIKAHVEQQVEVVGLKQKYSELKRESGLLKAMTKGMDSRSVLLATAGSAQKAELEARLREITGKAGS